MTGAGTRSVISHRFVSFRGHDRGAWLDGWIRGVMDIKKVHWTRHFTWRLQTCREPRSQQFIQASLLGPPDHLLSQLELSEEDVCIM